jgi:toxin YoeB
MIYALEFSKTALADIEKHKASGNKPMLKKIEKLLNELMHHPETGTGQPELLKHSEGRLYSRRINKTHRLVYAIHQQLITVHVLGAWSHHGDK